MQPPRAWLLAAAAALLLPPAARAQTPPGLQACRLDGVAHGAWCGSLQRPLDDAGRRRIDVQFAVLPALARNKLPDPVFFFAGGPGQGAIDIAGDVERLLARFANRRDIVLIDQRGTGRSAPLPCDTKAPGAADTRPLSESADPASHIAELQRCRERLQQLPHGDLRGYTTAAASRDADAVRQTIGAERINVVGVSYGTRVALDFMRQFPQRVRRVVLDGVAPPDMALPQAAATDARAAFDALLAACNADAGCAGRYPGLRGRVAALRASLPRTIAVRHPVTGADERLTLTAQAFDGLLRTPLYAPALAAALPQALADAADGRFEPLFGLAAAFGAGRGVAEGMHFSVVCAEDVPWMAPAADGAEAALYAAVCAGWPRADVPAAFRQIPPAPAPVLLLSGGIDPATPPRHAERVARALGANARSVVVANAGHGLLALPCLRDAVFRFIDAATDADALALAGTDCAAGVPRPRAAALLPR